MSGLIATGPAIRERLSCSALQDSHRGTAAERQDGLRAQARAGPVGPQSPQGLLSPLLGLASGLLQHHLPIHQPKLHLTVGVQPGLLADGLGNRDLPLAGDPHAEPIWSGKNLTGANAVCPGVRSACPASGLGLSLGQFFREAGAAYASSTGSERQAESDALEAALKQLELSTARTEAALDDALAEVRAASMAGLMKEQQRCIDELNSRVIRLETVLELALNRSPLQTPRLTESDSGRGTPK